MNLSNILPDPGDSHREPILWRDLRQLVTDPAALVEIETLEAALPERRLVAYGRNTGGSGRLPGEAKIAFTGDPNLTSTCWTWLGGAGAAPGRDPAKRYGNIEVDGHRPKTHVLAYVAASGPVPPGLTVDHRCHSTLCLRPTHLRVATLSEQNRHGSGPMITNRSGHRGVDWHKRTRAWRAAIHVDGHQRHIGCFATVGEACAAYQRAVTAEFGDFAPPPCMTCADLAAERAAGAEITEPPQLELPLTDDGEAA